MLMLVSLCLLNQTGKPLYVAALFISVFGLASLRRHFDLLAPTRLSHGLRPSVLFILIFILILQFILLQH